MRASHEHQVLFVHVQKTGGKTLDAMFDHEIADSDRGPNRSRHWGYTKILEAKPEYVDFWSFGFVRNPWARMVSWWSMATDMQKNLDAGDPEAHEMYSNNKDGWDPIMQYGDDFEAFVMRGTEEVPRLARSQVAMLTDRARRRRVDFIGRQENYVDDVNIVRKRLELDPVEALERRNTSAHGDFRSYYTPTTRRRVEEVFARDVRELGYRFSEPA
jgi:hypothetical protein